MVHTGFSRGCERCREKHFGCDQTKPECTKCTSQGLSCPGYRDQGGFLFKNETAKVARNGKQRHARRATAGKCVRSRKASKVEVVSISAAENEAIVHDSMLHLYSTNARNFAQAPEYNGFHIFLETYAMFNRNPTTTPANFETLALFYQNADITSPFFPVLWQVAGQLILLYHGMRYNCPLHYRSCVEASKAMREALCDPRQRRKNETLLALILLDLGERIEYARLLIPSSVEHHHAAIALIAERPPESFRDHVSQSLLDAARYIIIRKALCRNEEDLNLEVFARAEYGRPTTPSVALDRIISRVLVLRKHVSECLTGKTKGSSRELERLSSTCQDLKEQLLRWVETIPADWHPSLQPNPGFETVSLHRVLIETYSSYETAFIYNQWRCTQLLLLGISQSLSSLRSSAEQMPGYNWTRTAISEKAQTLCESILSAAPYLFRRPWRAQDFQTVVFAPAGGGLDKAVKSIPMTQPTGGRLGHWNLFELVQWMLRILADAEHGLAVDPEIIVESEEVLANLWF